ncbi:hypothetical protein U1Q18_021692 [Sarracenia purpurea var. burkii]
MPSLALLGLLLGCYALDGVLGLALAQGLGFLLLGQDADVVCSWAARCLLEGLGFGLCFGKGEGALKEEGVSTMVIDVGAP